MKSSGKKSQNTATAPHKGGTELFARGWIRILVLAIWFGALCSLSLEPWRVPGLIWVALWPMFYLARQYAHSIPRLIGIGALLSLSLCSFSFYWLLHLFQTFGGLNILLSLLIFIPYTILLNLKIPIFMAAYGLASRAENLLLPRWLLVGFLGLITDYFAPQVFPWYWGNLIAKNDTLSQVAEITGIYGLSFLCFAGSYILFQIAHACARAARESSNVAWQGRLSAACGAVRKFFAQHPSALAVPALFAVVLVFGTVRLIQIDALQQQLPKIRVAMIQPNTPLPKADEGRVPENIVEETIQKIIPDMVKDAEQNGPLGLIVLPESAVPNNLTTQDNIVTRYQGIYSRDYEEMVRSIAKRTGANIFTNEVAAEVKLDKYTGRPRAVEYNSSVLFSGDGNRRQFYHKRTLLAFGEYIPGADLLDGTGLIALVPEAVRYSRFERGEESVNLTYYRLSADGKSMEAAGEFLPLICYEILIPEYVSGFFQNGNPGLIVNITQDGWYGRTVETYQHFGLGRIRTIETRRALVRSTNSGSSAFVDLAGRVIQPIAGEAMSGQEVRAVQVWDVPVNEAPPTLYVRYGNRWILVFSILLFAGALLRWVLRRKK